MKNCLLIAVMILGFSSVSHAKENMTEDAQAIDSACAQDAAATGCGDKKVGTGLRVCMHQYKKEHHDYKFSEGCKSAMKKMHQDRKARKS